MTPVGGSARRPGGFSGFAPPLQVVGYIATRKGDAERGPLAKLCAEDALIRLVTDGELVRVVSERRQELATVQIDPSIPRGGVVLRDVAGAMITDIIRIIKLDTDAAPRV